MAASSRDDLGFLRKASSSVDGGMVELSLSVCCTEIGNGWRGLSDAATGGDVLSSRVHYSVSIIIPLIDPTE